MPQREELHEYRRRLLERYAAQPGELRAAYAAIPPEARLRPLERGGWTPHQVLAHVRDVELQAFLPRIERLLAEEDPALSDFDEGAWMDAHYDPDESHQAILEAFTAARTRGSGLLRDLSPEGWNRVGRHPLFGRRTLQWWVEYAVSHAQDHILQLRA